MTSDAKEEFQPEEDLTTPLAAPKDVHTELIETPEGTQEVLISWQVEEAPPTQISHSEVPTQEVTTFSVLVREAPEAPQEPGEWLPIPSAEEVTERRVSVSVDELPVEQEKQYQFKVVAKNKAGEKKDAVAPELILIRESILPTLLRTL